LEYLCEEEMMPVENKQLEKRLTYIALSSTFVVLLAIFNLLRPRRKQGDASIKPFDYILLGLSVFRMGRMVSYDTVMEPYRAPFTQVVPDDSGAGDTVEPRGEGWRRAIGELISCPICSGTWIAAVLVYGMQVAPGPTRALMAIMSVIGIGEVLNAATEALSWNAQLARERVGTYCDPTKSPDR
jgi:hypothetical protein